jgi:N utilization substance protein B
MTRPDDPRNEARRRALSLFFSGDFSQTTPEATTTLYQEEVSKKAFDEDLFRFLVEGITQNKEVIDEMIKTSATEWPLDKISKIDLVILRLAVLELLYSSETPVKVAVDEAVELAKTYGNDASSKFVNGVLGSIIEKYPPKHKILN